MLGEDNLRASKSAGSGIALCCPEPLDSGDQNEVIGRVDKERD
jgi:hypothetical protein